MQFHFPTGLEEKGAAMDKVQVICVETYSYVPRTNRRKLRKFLMTAWGVKPCYTKYFLKAMGFWSTERLGEPPAVRQEMYKQALAWQNEELKSLKMEHRT